jgi:hypothetical protein
MGKKKRARTLGRKKKVEDHPKNTLKDNIKMGL